MPNGVLLDSSFFVRNDSLHLQLELYKLGSVWITVISNTQSSKKTVIGFSEYVKVKILDGRDSKNASKPNKRLLKQFRL